MYLNSIVLKHYIPFQFSNIKELTIDFVSPTTVVVGTNGSGKSTLFRMLSPLPPSRSDFNKEGYKELHITHENDKYILVSDFTNKASPHSFVLNNVEFNHSGTTGVQEELIEKYLGYTSLDDKLLRMEIDLCRLGKSERKNLFLTISPTDFTLILNLHKKCLSQIKEYKNTLTHLYRRKEEIESRLLDITVLEETKKHKEQLEKDKNLIDKTIYLLQEHVNQIYQEYEIDRTYSSDNTFIQNASNYLKRLRIDFPKLSFINRETYLQDYRENDNALHICENEIQTYQQQLEQLTKEINEYNTHIQQQNKKPTTVIESEIISLKSTINELNKNIDLNTGIVLTIDQESIFLKYIETLKPKLEFLDNKYSHVNIWSNQVLLMVEKKLNHLITHIKYLQDKKRGIEQELHLINQEKNKYNLFVPDVCNFNNCGLKEKYLDKKDQADQKEITLNRDLKVIQTSIDHYLKVHSKLYDLYKDREPYTKLAYDISNIWYSTGLLSSVTLKYKLLHYLNKNPTDLLMILDHILENSKLIRHRDQLLEKQHLLETEIDAHIKAHATSKEFLEKLILEKEQLHKNLLYSLNLNYEKRKQYLEKNTTYERYIELKNDIKVKSETFYRLANKQIAYETTIFYKKYIESCNAVKNKIDEDLRQIDILIKEQDTLYARYEEEVMKQITIIEKEKIKYQGIEKELSPNNGLPHRYLVEFINTIIHNTNYFIAQVFSYPLKLVPIDTNTPIDFSFEVMVEHVRVPDISRLSKGQSEMVTIATTLAILLQKKMLNQYPLFLDEIGASFDPTHQIALLELLKSLQDRKMVNQMFIINHNSIYSNSMSDVDTIALKTDDVVLAGMVNEHVDIV